MNDRAKFSYLLQNGSQYLCHAYQYASYTFFSIVIC